MSDDTENSGMQTCPVCHGSGTILKDRDDTDICGPDVKELVCPRCGGKGRIQLEPRPLRIRFKRLSWKPRLSTHRPSVGRGGRLSRSPIILPPPGTLLSGYPEGDMVPELPANREHALRFDVNDQSNAFVPQENPPVKASEENIAADVDIAYTIGEGFSPGLEIFNGQQTEPPQAGQDIVISSEDGTASYEQVQCEPSDQLPIQQPILDPQQEISMEVSDSFTVEPTAPDVFLDDTEPIASLAGNTPLGAPGGPNGQSIGLSPFGQIVFDGFREPNPLDITGDIDPVGFGVDTDVIGNVGF